jgi:hypothetical protein
VALADQLELQERAEQLDHKVKQVLLGLKVDKDRRAYRDRLDRKVIKDLEEEQGRRDLKDLAVDKDRKDHRAQVVDRDRKDHKDLLQTRLLILRATSLFQD